MDCLFCDSGNVAVNRIVVENDLAYARWDNMPVSQGHLEVVPKRHVESFFSLNHAEVQALYDLMVQAKIMVEQMYHPDGYNLGVNEGEAAGRTIHHLHLHLIPRYHGDVPSPRGGIRHIIPGKGNY
jgi:diadenosine tetraphosphate (Ap4A) HIT family hydrolase